MKKIMILAVALVAFASCKKQDLSPVIQPKQNVIIGTWINLNQNPDFPMSPSIIFYNDSQYEGLYTLGRYKYTLSDNKDSIYFYDGNVSKYKFSIKLYGGDSMNINSYKFIKN